MMRSALFPVLLLLFAVAIGCNRNNDATVEPSATLDDPTVEVVNPASPKPHPTAPGLDLIRTATAEAVLATAVPTPNPEPDGIFAAETVLGELTIDHPVQPFEPAILALPLCQVHNAPLIPDGIVLGTVPLPTPAASSRSSQSVGAGEIELQRYVKTVYPSLNTAMGWSSAIDDVALEDLDTKAILTLLYMESSRISGVCKAVALIPPVAESEVFHDELSSALMARHTSLADARDLASLDDIDVDQIVSILGDSIERYQQLDLDLAQLSASSNLEYPPPLAGLILDSTELGIQVSIPPGWQLTGVIGNLSLLAPPRMQGGALNDVGSHFGSNGSEFVFSKLRNPTNFSERDMLDRVERLLQPYGDLILEEPGQVASLEGHVLEYIDRETDLSTSVWVVAASGFSNIFRVSCPSDLIDACLADILPMINSATITE